MSDESKRGEVYVQSFPAPGSKYQVSTAGGSLPVWSRDGKELFYASARRELMAVAVEGNSGGRFVNSVPKLVFELPPGGLTDYGVSPDGKRFLMSPLQSDRATPPIAVVLNWQAGLRK